MKNRRRQLQIWVGFLVTLPLTIALLFSFLFLPSKTSARSRKRHLAAMAQAPMPPMLCPELAP